RHSCCPLLILAAGEAVHSEHGCREQQGDDRNRHSHGTGVTELALPERRVEQLLTHHQGAAVWPPCRVQCLYVDEQVQRDDADVDVGGLHVVANQRQGDGDRRPPPACTIDAGGFVCLCRHAFDSCDEQEHVETDEPPQHHEHRH